MIHICIRVLIVLMLATPALQAESWRRVTIVEGDQATEIDRRVVALLSKRIAEQSHVDVKIEQTIPADGRGLVICPGHASRHSVLRGLMDRHQIAPPTEKDPGPEGFVVASVPSSHGQVILAAAVDQRSVLYAAGEILRRITFHADHVQLESQWQIRSAPAFEVRGTGVSQGHTMQQITKARAWTHEEWQRAVLNYALAGANTIALGHVRANSRDDYDFVRSYGLKVLLHHTPNVGSGPDEWTALEAIGRKGYLCPSVPAARAALLKACENRFRDELTADYVQMNAGDGGGCVCDRCAPYGRPFVKLCADMTKIIHRYHPQTEVFITNQKLDNAGEQAIFDYLNDNPGDWLRAISYGPGSNAMGWMPGRRQDHRMDLFRYRAFGALDRYCREIIHQLPPQQSLVFFTDLTHWVYSQYGLMDHEMLADRNSETPPLNDYWMYEKKPDPYLAMVYDRRTFHARPRHYYHVFRETQRYGIGDCTYSEGHHDHFNQWMQQRLLWHPNRSVEEIVNEYSREHFGPEAAVLMTDAIFQLEQNLSTPITDNPGVDRLVNLVRSAGKVMPPHRMQKDYLWHQYLQKALLDKYVQLRVIRQLKMLHDANEILRRARSHDDPQSQLSQVLQILNVKMETEEMEQLRNEADQAGQTSERVYGVRNLGIYALDQDLVGLGWLKSEVQRAASAPANEVRPIIRGLVDYEDAGEGGFYDDLGNPDRSPRLTVGRPYDGAHFPTSLRPSQRTAAFTTHEQQGVTLEYRDLDRTAKYRVRFALIRPVYKARYADRQPQTSQSILADGEDLTNNVELPTGAVGIFEYPIPHNLTADGRLTVSLKKADGVGEGLESVTTVWRNTGGWGTLASDVWLLKDSDESN